MFKNYYLSLLIFALIPLSCSIHLGIGGATSLCIIFWYSHEEKELNKNIGKLEAECHEKLKSIISNISSINYNIIEKLSFSWIDEQNKKDILEENILLLDDIFEKMRNILNISHKINFLTNNCGFLFVNSQQYSYISHCYILIESLNLYKFYKKFKDAKIIDDVEKYRKDWLDLYAHYRLEY